MKKLTNPRQEIIIKPPSKSIFIDFHEIYRFRHLLGNLVWRDIKVQFDQMYLGAIWATVRPLLMVSIFALFRHLSGANLHVNIPYPIYVYSGLILWFYFIEATSNTARSLEKNASLITKVYYPRVINLMVPVIANLYNLGIAMLPLLSMMVWQQVYPGWEVLLLPLVVLQCMLLVLAVGALFATLSLESKDFDKLLGQILYIGLYISPVIFAPGLVPNAARPLYFANPMAGTLLAFRGCLFDDFDFPWGQWLYAIVATLVLLLIALAYYHRVEAYIADKL